MEVLSFAGCPHREPAIELVERIVSDLGVDAEVVCVDVPNVESAGTTRFLGSPSIRVDGADVEPDARNRTDFLYGCRVYRNEAGLSGQPDEKWIRAALAASQPPTGEATHAVAARER